MTITLELADLWLVGSIGLGTVALLFALLAGSDSLDGVFGSAVVAMGLSITLAVLWGAS